jgi:hypothetical protein
MTIIERRPAPRTRVERSRGVERDRRRPRLVAPRPAEGARVRGTVVRVSFVAALAGAAVAAGLLAFLVPLTPGFSATDTGAAAAFAALVATLATGTVLLARRLAPSVAASPPRSLLVFAVALLSAGAAAIHLAVARPHLDEYALFGVFFVAAGIAQLVWPLWILLSGWRPLLVLGALGNAAIAALWAVDRLWGLPLGPVPWTPDPVGFGDSVASAFELLIAAGCLVLLLRGRGGGLRSAVAAGLAVAVAALTALSLLSVLGVWSSVLAPTV